MINVANFSTILSSENADASKISKCHCKAMGTGEQSAAIYRKHVYSHIHRIKEFSFELIFDIIIH